MQLVHCTVNLAGDPRKQVRRVNVSVPEIQLLQEIHGNDAVIDLKYAGERTGVDEREMLVKFYGGKAEVLEKVEKLFPGARPNLPQNLADIGFEAVATPEIVEAFKKKKAADAKAEADRKARVKAAQKRRTEALAEADEAAEEESELIAPPPIKKKVADPLMA